jgi:hypothetical protein
MCFLNLEDQVHSACRLQRKSWQEAANIGGTEKNPVVQERPTEVVKRRAYAERLQYGLKHREPTL